MNNIHIFEDIRLYALEPKDNGKDGITFIGIWDDSNDTLDKNCKCVANKNNQDISVHPNTIFRIENTQNYNHQYQYLNIKPNKLYKISEDQKIYEYFSEEAEILRKNKLIYDPEM